MEFTEKKYKIENERLLKELTFNEELLKKLESRFSSSISLRGDTLIIKGATSDVHKVEGIIKEWGYIISRNGELAPNDIDKVFELLNSKNEPKINDTIDFKTIYPGYKDVIRAKNEKQIEYNKIVHGNDLVFAIGPAGTGKTFLAVAMALAALRNNEVSRIILSRPAVEAGESLGFLPGDFKEKLDPYLRPLTDSLVFMLGPDKMKSLMEKNVIEITPLAYMRGRTLNSAFIILDEAQNATITQMKMFLTRLGIGSKAIVTGDVTQVDLQDKSSSGLIHVQYVLKKIKGIEFIYFSNKDVIRHRLVADIIRAYEKDNEKRIEKKNKDE
jgi:phosphate starvation-inducible PhoH-like protein